MHGGDFSTNKHLVQAKVPMNPIEKNCFLDVKNHSDKVLMISIQILVQRFQKWAQGRGTQPLQSKEIKLSSNSLIPKVCQRAVKLPMVLSKFKSKYLCSMGQKQRKHPRQAVFNCISKKGFFSQCCVLE
jgi:hypothetical protein